MTDDSHARLGDLLPAYALGALEGAELAELERHLASGCLACQRDLSGWRQDLERLAEEIPGVEPHPQVRAAVLAQVAAGSAPRPARHRAFVLAAGTALLVVGGALWLRLSQRVEELAAEGARLETHLATVSRDLAEARAAAARLAAAMEIISAPGTEAVMLAGLAPAPRARARAFLDAAAGRAVFYAYDLPPLGSDRTYQLWVIADGKPISAGIFAVDEAGHAAVDVAGMAPRGAIRAWAVTVEPRGGVPLPTGEMVLKS
jgi:anti-sigma-K factor RskA